MMFIVNRYVLTESAAQAWASLTPNSKMAHACERAILNCGKPHVFKQNGVWIRIRTKQ
ncbi:MAG TPA: hypothetical protein VJ840_18640 [Gemmatimonadaceae bacterium]|nr:hypothetical protein [Gemmatimonadaceae bacterium]